MTLGIDPKSDGDRNSQSQPVSTPESAIQSDTSSLLPSSIVLLVDDNPMNLGVLFESLGDAGFKLLVAESGDAALEQVQLLKPDIILLDVMMPGLNGFDTCRQLKSNPATADIPVVFMTALTDTVDKIQGLTIGAVDYITKPIQPDEALARVKTHLTVYHLRQQLKQHNQQLQQEIQERKAIEQSLRLLLRSVSHDLRNPVNGMIMVLNNLLNGIGVSLPASAMDHDSAKHLSVPRQTLERMVKSCDRQLQLINSLLETHSSIPHGSGTAEPASEQGGERDIVSASNSVRSPIAVAAASPAPAIRIELHRQAVQIAHLIDGITLDIQPLLEQHPATLELNVPATLPRVNADPTQLWRVLENLITNAIKHNPPGVEVAIAISPSDSNTIKCEVKDNGNGISQAEQQSVFNPYRRGMDASETPGLGLGLYLCQQIIQAHGGDIQVDSQLNHGSTFWFTLPQTTP